MSKSITQLESLNRELQERSRILENSKSQMDKDYYQLQAVLEAERRDRGHDSEMIGDLQGNIFSYSGKIDIKFTVLAIFKYIVQWHKIHSHCHATITTVHLQNFFHHSKLKKSIPIKQ